MSSNLEPDTSLRRRACRTVGIWCTALVLAACGGGSSTSTDSTTPSGAGATLFVADRANAAVAVFSTLSPTPGTTLSGRVLSGLTNFEGGIAYDSGRDALYAVTGTSISVYAQASTLSGHAVPARTIVPTGTSITVGIAVVYDKTHDRLYFGGAEPSNGIVLVFEAASTLNGSVAPSRIVRVGSLNAFTVDTQRSILYVGGATIGVDIYDNFDTLSGLVLPSRRINGVSALGIAVDASRDLLYTSDVFSGVGVFSNASSPTLVSNLALIQISSAYSLAVDPSHDRLYVGAYDKGYVIDNVSTFHGNATAAAAVVSSPTSVISGFAFP